MISLKYYSKAHEQWVASLLGKIQQVYGEHLTSLAIFGSYARQENRLNSDLDLLIIVQNFEKKGRLKRQGEFVHQIEMPLESLARTVHAEGISTEVSNLLLTPFEADRFLPIYLDMTAHHMMVIDRGGFLQKILERTGAQMKKWGSQRKQAGNHWYWEIRPGLKWNEVLDYDQ